MRAHQVTGTLLIALLPWLSSCSQKEQAEPAGRAASDTAAASLVQNSVLRQELLEMQRAAQSVRARLLQKGYENIGPRDVAQQDSIDAANTARLDEIVNQCGWPTIEMVGADAVEAAFLIVQHSDLAFQKEMLPHVRGAFERGELPGEALALLTDRVLVAEGKPQLYGTQATLVGGELVFAPIADSASVDKRRSELGMGPIAEYRRALQEAYGLESPGSREQ